MTDRLFDQPVVKVLPFDEINNNKSSSSPSLSNDNKKSNKEQYGSTIQRLKANKTNFEDLPLPPSVSSENIIDNKEINLSIENNKFSQDELNKQSIIDINKTSNESLSNIETQENNNKREEEEEAEHVFVQPTFDYLKSNTEENTSISLVHNTESISSYAQINSNESINPLIEDKLKKKENNLSTNETCTPSYAQLSNTSSNQIYSSSSSSYIEQNNSNSNSTPAYLQFSNQNIQPDNTVPSAYSSNSSDESSSVPLYAQFNNMSVNSSSNYSSSNFTANNINQSNNQPSYLQFSSTVSQQKEYTSRQQVNEYQQNVNNHNTSNQQFTSNMHSTMNYNNQNTFNSNLSSQYNNENNQQINPLPLEPTKYIPARNDYVAYHGHQSVSKNIQPSPLPMPATNWMNAYQSQSSDEMFVLEQWFKSVDQDNSGQIDAEELEGALNASGDKFDKGTVSLMIKIFDIDRNGEIDFNEFVDLFKYIKAMRESFESFDTSNKGLLNENQCVDALRNAKYNFQNPFTVKRLFAKFSNKSGGLSFECFMQMAIFLGNLRTLFTLHDTKKTGFIQLNEEEFILLDCVPYT